MNLPPTQNRRWRQKPCTNCGGIDWMFGRRKLCAACRLLRRKTSPEAVIKKKAQVAASAAVRRGLLVRGKCCVCELRGFDQRGISHGHHEDYSKPLDVIWLCSMHHIWTHQIGLENVFKPSKAASRAAQ